MLFRACLIQCMLCEVSFNHKFHDYIVTNNSELWISMRDKACHKISLNDEKRSKCFN